MEQSSSTRGLIDQFTGGQGILNKSNVGKNPDLYQISIFDSGLCYAFIEAFANNESQSMHNIRAYIETDESLFVNKIFFSLSVTSGFVDASLLEAEFRNQAFIQNRHNVSLIPRELENTRNRGIKQMHTVFKRKTKKTPSTLIVGSTTQSEMLFLVPNIVARYMEFFLGFTFVASKNKAKEILLDLTREGSLKQTNFILAGYFF